LFDGKPKSRVGFIAERPAAHAALVLGGTAVLPFNIRKASITGARKKTQ